MKSPRHIFLGLRTLSAVVLSTALLSMPVAQAAEQASAKLNINLRAAPNLKSPIVGVLKPGVVVEVLSSHGEFVRVRRADGVQGHLKRKHLSTVSVSVLAPVSVPTASAAAPRVAPVLAPPPPVSSPAASAAAAAPAPAAAAAAVPAAPAASPWYVRASAGVGFAARTPEAIERALDTAGGSVSLRKLDTAVPAFALEVGYAFTPQLALELGLMHLGRYQGEVQATGADAQRLQTVLTESYPHGDFGIDALAVVQQPLGAWRLGAGAGLFCAVQEPPLNTSALGIEVDYRPCAPLLNLRVGRALDAHWTLGLTSSAVFFDNRVFMVGVALQYQ